MVQQPVTIHRPVSEQVDRHIVQARRDPPAALVEQPFVNIGPSLLFSQIEDEYIATRENGGASAGTIRARHLVCARQDPAARLLRRHLDQLDCGVESQGVRIAYDIYAFLTTEPNAEVGAIHPKAMPVILTRPEAVELG